MIKRSKKALSIFIIIGILLILAAILFATSRYKSIHFGDARIDEIIFYYTNGLADGRTDTLWQAAQDSLLFLSITLFLISLPVFDLFRNRIKINLNLSFIGRRKKLRQINPSKISVKYKLLYAIVIFLISVWTLASSFGIPGYIKSLGELSTVFEENYVKPASVDLKFPEKKRNLIYIYMESMENTVASRQNGGQSDKSIIPELEQIALNNTSFSHTKSGLGGALPADGTTWTVGGMTAQSAGIPLKPFLGKDRNDMGYFDQFLPGAYTLGEVLEKAGYNQTFVMGSDAKFGGRDKLLTQHGNYQILDYVQAQQSGKLAPDYKVWWGYEDKKMFAYAKEEATRLSKEDAPFNLQLLTVDTHFTDGWLDETCPKPHQNQYDNVHACSSSQVAEFVNWVQKQPFAKDTTIILTGDHLGMQTSYYDQKVTDPRYKRTIYNAFINPVIKPVKSNERLFSSFDMYPTTLAAIGVGIPGEKMGLGVNLFSDQPTLVEQFGSIEALNDELRKRSDFYQYHLLIKND